MRPEEVVLVSPGMAANVIANKTWDCIILRVDGDTNTLTVVKLDGSVKR